MVSLCPVVHCFRRGNLAFLAGMAQSTLFLLLRAMLTQVSSMSASIGRPPTLNMPHSSPCELVTIVSRPLHISSSFSVGSTKATIFVGLSLLWSKLTPFLPPSMLLSTDERPVSPGSVTQNPNVGCGKNRSSWCKLNGKG